MLTKWNTAAEAKDENQSQESRAYDKIDDQSNSKRHLLGGKKTEKKVRKPFNDILTFNPIGDPEKNFEQTTKLKGKSIAIIDYLSDNIPTTATSIHPTKPNVKNRNDLSTTHDHVIAKCPHTQQNKHIWRLAKKKIGKATRGSITTF